MINRDQLNKVNEYLQSLRLGDFLPEDFEQKIGEIGLNEKVIFAVNQLVANDEVMSIALEQVDENLTIFSGVDVAGNEVISANVDMADPLDFEEIKESVETEELTGGIEPGEPVATTDNAYNYPSLEPGASIHVDGDFIAAEDIVDDVEPTPVADGMSDVFEAETPDNHGVELADDPNFQAVLDELLNSGVRFAAGGAAYISGSDSRQFKLYTRDGEVALLTEAMAIKTVNGKHYLTERNPEHDYSPVISTSANEHDNTHTSEAKKAEPDSIRKPGLGGGGFSFFSGNSVSTGKKSEAARHAAQLAPALLSSALIQDLEKATSLLDEIGAGPKPSMDAQRRFQDILEKIQANAEALSKAAMDGASIPRFDVIQDNVNAFMEKLKISPDILIAGKSIMDSEPIKGLKESMSKIIESISSLVRGMNNG